MIRALIIDDEEHGIKSLELLLAKYCPEIKLVASSSSPRQSIQLINDYQPDIVFLDIYMPEMNGFDLLEQLSFRDFHLIFTTAYREYALKALKANAFDYLLKPIDFEELQKAVEKVKLKKSNNHKIAELLGIMNESMESKHLKVMLPTKTSIESVLSNEIVYIEAQSNHSLVALVNKQQHLTLKSLKEYEELLCQGESRFFRIQNSFIINLNEVVRYTKEDGGFVTMSDGKEIPVSKLLKKDFLSKFGLESN
ncbi:MAG: response regulator transcription factor [Bacteroidia bacterium]|nr:response regulator transcription factor [Bacteroidia bacterium]